MLNKVLVVEGITQEVLVLGITLCFRRGPHLGEVELELLAPEGRFMQLYPGAGCRFGAAEVDAHTPETLEQLEGGVVVIHQEQGLEHLL